MSTAQDWRELALRDGDGLQISLLWSESADSVKVSVCDERHGESFDIHVADAQALRAFYHPFAYTPGGGLRAGVARRMSLDLQLQS